MTWLHTWTGLLFCWVLYFVFVTGSFGYFDTEIDHWMRPEHPIDAPPGVRRAVELAEAFLRDEAPDAESWSIRPARGREPLHLEVGWAIRSSEDPEAPHTFHQRQLSTETGLSLPEARATAGGQQLYQMHFVLHYLPDRSGFYLVTVATMVMFVGLVTGIIAHKRIFKDFFTLRLGKGQRSWLDLHNLLGVATMPFLLMITYSGLLFTVPNWMPFVPIAAFDFDTEEFQEASGDLFGFVAVERSNLRVPLVEIAPLVDEALRAWGDTEISSVEVQVPGDLHARVLVRRSPAIGMFGDAMAFDGTTGARLRVYAPHSKAPVAAVPSTLLGLHTGLFADALVRWLYFLSGLLGAAVVATGAIYWVIKRRPDRDREDELLGYRLVERLNVGTIAGLIIGVAAFFWANRLLPVGMENRAEWELHILFLAWGACLVHAFARPVRQGWIEQSGAAAVLLLGIPLLNAVTTDAHLGRSVPAGDWIRVGFDLTAVAFGAIAAIASVLMAYHWPSPSPSPDRKSEIASAAVEVTG
ncbi:MAG: PepSY-associated TM helix domain-containing protein [Myxococcota bacterium]